MTVPNLTRLHQTITEVGGPVKGDCWRTALACLLGLDRPQDVPHFINDSGENWWRDSQVFVADATGGEWKLLCYDPVFPLYYPHTDLPVHVIVTGRSPRGDWSHCVIASAMTGQMVWDPHPDGTGVLEPIEDVCALIPGGRS